MRAHPVLLSLIVLLAAGMSGQAAHYLVQAGVLPGIIEPLWDTSGWLPAHGVIGGFLHVLVGYDDRPSLTQVLFFSGTLAAGTAPWDAGAAADPVVPVVAAGRGAPAATHPASAHAAPGRRSSPPLGEQRLCLRLRGDILA